MSDGLKTGLIVGGAAVVGYLIWRNSQSAAAVLTPPITSTTAAPGAPTPTSLVGAVTVGSSTSTSSTPSKSGPSLGGTLKAVGVLAAAPVIIPTVVTVKAGEAVAHGVVSAGKAVGSAASSIGHAIASIL